MNDSRRYTHGIFIVIILGIFALSSIGLALLGVNVYQTTTTTSNEELNSCALFFTNQVRECPDKSMIRVANLEGENPALVIGTYNSGIEQETWLYVSEGQLREITVDKGNDVDAQNSEAIMPMKSADFKMITDKLLQISLQTDDGQKDNVNLCLIGGGGSE